MSEKSPCRECGHKEFMVLPHILITEISKSVMGGMASQNLQRDLRVTLVVCAACARTDLYTTNAEGLMKVVPDARMVSAG
jgi:hypothetical protein